MKRNNYWVPYLILQLFIDRNIDLTIFLYRIKTKVIRIKTKVVRNKTKVVRNKTKVVRNKTKVVRNKIKLRTSYYKIIGTLL